jgi:hypothetical protein
MQCMAGIEHHTLTKEDDATERAILAASASLFDPVTVTCIRKGTLEDCAIVLKKNTGSGYNACTSCKRTNNSNFYFIQ